MTRNCDLCGDGDWPLHFYDEINLPGCAACVDWDAMTTTFWETGDLDLAIVKHYEHPSDDKPVPESVREAREAVKQTTLDAFDDDGPGGPAFYAAVLALGVVL